MQQYDDHVSRNAVRGSLGEVSIDRLLEICRDEMLTGRIDVDSGGGAGSIELRAGVIDRVEHAGNSDDGALARLRQLTDGSYQVTQRLPQLNGALGTAASFDGNSADLSLVDLMRHCEENALTCCVAVVHDYDRAELHFRAGMIVDVIFNGESDEESIVDIVRWRDARYRVTAPPLEITGRPVRRRAPTEPFVIDHLKSRPRRSGSICELTVADDDFELPPPPPAPRGRVWRAREGLARRLRAASDWLESDALDRIYQRLVGALRRRPAADQ